MDVGPPSEDERVSDHARAALHELAAAYGVDVRYHDWQGRPQIVSDGTLRAVLTAFDVDVSTPDACARSLRERRRRDEDHRLPPCVVLRTGDERRLVVSDEARKAEIELEDGAHRPLTITPDDAGRATCVVPADLPTGYHRLIVTTDGAARTTEVIVCPARLAVRARLADPGWGFAVQLYSVRSGRSWGVGDLADLGTIATWSATALGADFVLVNPLHAAEVVPPMDPSPYLPTSRRYGNPLYLAVDSIPAYLTLPSAVRAEVDALADAVRERLSHQPLIERDEAWQAKRSALQAVYDSGRDDAAAAAFTAYRDAEGADLVRFTRWCALTEVHGGDWHDWPAALHDPSGPDVEAAAETLSERVDFHAWLQWQLAEQLADAQHRARDAGMRVGVIHDLAVGVGPAGADAWSYQDVLATGLRVGAPPDAYSQTGQDWQQPPWRPDRLAELAYAPLRGLFRNALQRAGGLRVDHIIGLFRLWWIPDGAPAAEGTYVHYDHEALVGVLALEAERAGALVIGEDLGNVEPWVRDYLHERGILGTSILWFEADEHGAPLAPERWRTDCLASVTTHDLPPTTGYLAGDHIRLRAELGLLTRTVEDELAAQHHELDGWLAELRRAGLLSSDEQAPDEQAVVRALHAFLSRTPSLLRCVALTDAVGERRTQNQPGTREEYPNWRVPLAGPDGVALTLEQVVRDPRVGPIAQAVAGDGAG